MANDADVEAFDRRAATYDVGAVARWHATVVDRSADVALAAMPSPLRLLDVGCGTGALLRELIVRVPYADAFVGVDPAPNMLAVARRDSDSRIAFVRGTAEALPFPDASFDLVVTSTSFDHWADQRRGLAELARVVGRRGHVVLVDVSAGWLPQKGRARSPRKVRALLRDAGLRVERVETVYRLAFVLPLVRAYVTAP